MGVKQAFARIRAASNPYFGATFEGMKIWRATPIYDLELIQKLPKDRGFFSIEGVCYLILSDGALILDKVDDNER